MATSPLDTVPMPARIAALPRDHRGYPVPYFVEWRDGKPLFPVFSPKAWVNCVHQRKCWICGQPLGRTMIFVVGPMCTINRISAEPPSHFDCARYALEVCPFLINPRMGRVPTERFGEVSPPGGLMDEGNPGVTASWSTRAYRIIRTATGPLVELGNPLSVDWWTRGHVATSQEAADAFIHGAAKLLKRASDEAGEQGIVAITQMIIEGRKLLPDPELVTEIVGD
jgi:hypothetical protein